MCVLSGNVVNQTGHRLVVLVHTISAWPYLMGSTGAIWELSDKGPFKKHYWRVETFRVYPDFAIHLMGCSDFVSLPNLR